MDPEEKNSKIKLIVSLPYDTPVVGIPLTPSVRLFQYVEGKFIKSLQHSSRFRWFRQKQIFCSVHSTLMASVQCIDCVTLELPVRESYHCSTECLAVAWYIHVRRHHQATESLSGNQEWRRRLKFFDSCPRFTHGSSIEENAWSQVGSSELYVPTIDDSGLTLMLETEAKYTLHQPSFSRNITFTKAVIIPPATHKLRHMIQMVPLKMSSASNVSVLSYNILSDLLCTKHTYKHCPAWALAWEYRRQNLLQEIISYDADILCLQEVQSDHLESFFKPELSKRGYSVHYKKKSIQVYTASQYTTDGCAIFFRDDKFKAVSKIELEFDKIAAKMVLKLNPDKQKSGSIRLMKDNVALVVMLELKNSNIPMPFRKICVANTHIHSNSNLPDVKLFQVVQLINYLNSFAGAPILICGDMNSLPGSDPYKFLVTGSLNPFQTADPLGICPLLKLQHSIHLVSAYSSLLKSAREKKKMNVETKEPLFTRFTPESSGTLDYIFYSETCLTVEGLLELLDKKSMGGAGLPSKLWSSDHIALMANFSINPTASEALYTPPLFPPHPCQQAAAW